MKSVAKRSDPYHRQSNNMSLNNSFVTKSVSKNSDSFEDRFCDDLWEEILQYLPLKDKIRLESVSKQFQRTVFVKQYSLTLDHFELCRKFAGTIFERYLYFQTFPLFLNKCPNIRRIDFHFHDCNEIRRKNLQLITKYCNNLTEFRGSLFYLNEPEFIEFHEKFGSKLKKLGNIDQFSRLQLTSNCGFQAVYLAHPLTFHFEDIYRLNSIQLEELSMTLIDENIVFFREVLQKFNKIRHLGLYLKTNNEITVFKALNESPVLQNIIDIYIMTLESPTYVFSIYTLKHLAKNLPNLKRIQFFNEIKLENISDIEQLMSSLKAFPHLKRLDFRLQFKPLIELEDIFSFKGFPEQLTHLILSFRFRAQTQSVSSQRSGNSFTETSISVYQKSNHCRRRRSDTNGSNFQSTNKT